MNKNALYIAALIGLGAFYGYDQLYPEYEKMGTEIAGLQAKLTEARQTAPKLAQLKHEEQELKSRLNASLTKLPSGAELDNLLVLVIPILNEVGISSDQVEGKNVGAPTEMEVYRIHPIQMTGIKNVSMMTTVRLLHALRNFDRIINVNRAQIARTGPDRYTLDLDLATYSYIETEDDLGLTIPAAPEPVVSENEPDTGASNESPSDTTAAVSDSPARAGGAVEKAEPDEEAPSDAADTEASE